jgi:hypothetical protein
VIPFWPDKTTYYVPWVSFRTGEGDKAEGPMMRKGLGRQEILAWTDREQAKKASNELVAQTGGKYEIRTLDRKGLWAACKEYAAWGSKVVVTVMK